MIKTVAVEAISSETEMMLDDSEQWQWQWRSETVLVTTTINDAWVAMLWIPVSSDSDDSE
jgi:hypothetical protein